MLWRGSGEVLAMLWRGSGEPPQRLWPCSGEAPERLWPCSGEALERLWPWSGEAPERLWPCSGHALERLWRGSGEALAMLGRGSGEALTMLLRCFHRYILSSGPYFPFFVGLILDLSKVYFISIGSYHFIAVRRPNIFLICAPSLLAFHLQIIIYFIICVYPLLMGIGYCLF